MKIVPVDLRSGTFKFGIRYDVDGSTNIFALGDRRQRKGRQGRCSGARNLIHTHRSCSSTNV